MDKTSLSIRHWRFSTIKEHIRAAEALLKEANTDTTKNGYVFCTRGRNWELFRLLDLLGFFDFHSSNKKRQRAYVHQIVLYLHKGWKMYRKGAWCVKGDMEVHHLNGVVDDNDKHNLVYVTPEENKLLACIVGQKNFSEPRQRKAVIRYDFHKLLMSTMWATYLKIARGCVRLATALMNQRVGLTA